MLKVGAYGCSSCVLLIFGIVVILKDAVTILQFCATIIWLEMVENDTDWPFWPL